VRLAQVVGEGDGGVAVCGVAVAMQVGAHVTAK
jgi:hypothetical protein